MTWDNLRTLSDAGMTIGAHSRSHPFLKINLRTNWANALFGPYIEVRYDGVKRRQYFEKTAQGIRYLNLSSLVDHASDLSASDKITLIGHHCSWIKGSTELYRFHNQAPHKSRILIIAPHPDDAEIAAFGLYANRDSYIITITAGEEGKGKYTTFFPDRREHAIFQGSIRTWDSIEVPFWGNVSPNNCLDLGYFDRTLKDMFQNPTRPVSSMNAGTSDLNTFRKYNNSNLMPKEVPEPTWDHLVEELSRLLTVIAPDIIATPNPLTDGHPDHELSTIAVIEALQKAGINKGSLYLYTVPCEGVTVFLKSSAMRGPSGPFFIACRA